jgi:membrane-bound metal-dependent hydrolase YbcI (DUF457 family)
MFIGHFAAAFAAKKAAPSGSLGSYFAAAQLPDLLWPLLVLTGVERVTIAPGDTAFTPLRFDSYPISHSLLLDLVWAAAFGALLYWRTRSRRPALVAGLLVLSHWVLDVVSHRKDMPLLPGYPLRLGLGLWNSIPATLAVECGLFIFGVWLYVKATPRADGVGNLSLAALVAILLTCYAGAAFGGPPPGVVMVALTGLVGAALLLGMAWWVDERRSKQAT